MGAFLTSAGLLALVTLTFLEIVLGVDNVIFISILSSKLPRDTQPRARRTGLRAALFGLRPRYFRPRPDSHRRRFVPAGEGHARDSRTARRRRRARAGTHR